MQLRACRAVVGVMCIVAWVGCGASPTSIGSGIRSAEAVTTAVPDAQRSSLEITPATRVADGKQTASVTVHLRDSRGRAIRGYSVQLAASGTGNVFQPAATGTTDLLGNFIARLSSTSAGVKTVTARASPIALSGTVKFVAGPVSASSSAVVAAPARAANDGHSTATVGAVLRDSFGNPVPGVFVWLSIGGSSNVTTPSAPYGLTDANGMFTVALSSTKAETKSITAITATLLSLHGSVEFATDAISSWLSTIETGDRPVVANGHGRAPVIVTLRDALGRPVPNQPVTLKASGSNNAFVAPAPAPSAAKIATNALHGRAMASASLLQAAAAAPGGAPVTDPSGTASSSLASLTPETKTVSATAGGVTIAKPATFVSSAWVTLTSGLSGGWVGDVVAPRDGSLLAATGAGPYRSSDGRAAWVAADGGFVMRDVKLTLDPVTGSVYCISDPLLYRSDDYGITWTQLASPNPLDFVFELQIDPANPQVLYGVGGYGIYRSNDGGLTWSDLVTSTGLIGNVSVFSAFAVDPFQPATFYLGIDSGGVYISNDAGGTWTQTPGPPAGAQRIAPDPRVPGRLFAGTRAGAFVSKDGGASWSMLYDGPLLVIEFLPDRTDVDRVLLAPIGYGQGIVSVSVSTGAATVLGPQGMDIWHFTDANGRLLATNNDSSRVSLFASDDWGVTWAPAQDGIAELMTNGVILDPSNPQVLYASANGVMKSTDGGDTWVQTVNGLPAGAMVSQLLLDSSTLYATTWLGTYRSTDAAATWTIINDYSLGLVLDTRHPGALYAMTPSNDINHSDDSGTTWSFLSNPTPAGWQAGLIRSPAEPGVLFLGERSMDPTGGSMLLRSEDGVTWSVVNSSLSRYAFVVPDPVTVGTFYMLDQFGGPLMRSTDGGVSFAPVGDSPPWGSGQQIFTIDIDPKAPATIWVASWGQIFRSRDGGATWVEADEGAAGALVLSLAFHPTDPDTVFAGTYGNGVLRTHTGGILTGVAK